MKTFLSSAIALLMLGIVSLSCNQNPASTEVATTDSTLKFKFPEEFIGLYFTEAYIQSINQTHSPRQSQNVAYFSGLAIYLRNDTAFVTMDFNHHEGGWEIPIIMTDKFEGYALNMTENTADFHIRFNEDGSLFIEDDDWKGIMIKVQNQPELNLIDESVNALLFPNPFYHNDKIIQFLEDGKITGIDSLSSYYIYVDYFGPGMDFDMIEFVNKYNNQLIYTYGFEFSDSSFQIFDLICVDLEDDLCNEHEKGELKFELKYN